MKEHVMRLLPGEDLVLSLHNYCKKHEIKAAYIGTCVGSFQRVVFRKGYDQVLFTMEGPFEIVSMEGTLSNQGMHLHTAVSDTNFKVYGGHLLVGSIIQSTAEIVLIELESHELRRSKGDLTDFKELHIDHINKCSE
ncbi:PPC domain-containing DNA-binding protein [Erysipelothrix urinaevulpis]|uniref:PPC domain-containing DNA-binding protein n=1 Tax=Erysipelothrix urinaevulpis TaxID=2683717 RepID=UPI00135946F8|nr:PPC domain-containing DNA-binding protein [Erysipelothrix urinaevulpis]